MTGFQLDARSRRLLQGVHPDLVKVVLRAADISPIPFKAIEGLRTLERQKELLKQGATKTLNSRHLDGHAVDIVPLVDIDKDGKVSTSEMFAWPPYHQLAAAMKEAARQVGVPIEWGGDWRTFKDGPHWQLPFGRYPAGGNPALAFAEKRGLLMANAVRADVEEVEAAGFPRTDYETDSGAAIKAASSAALSAGTSYELGADPMLTLVSNLSAQQYELSSGDAIRIILAVTVIGLGFWYAYKKAKG